MADEPILIGLPGVTWDLGAETGGAIQSYSRETSRKLLEVYDAGSGKTTGLVFHDPKAEYEIEIILTSASGLALASPGVALTLASLTSGNGVSTGGVYCKTVRRRHAGEDFLRLIITACQYPAIA